jgi:HEAT repeat protein
VNLARDADGAVRQAALAALETLADDVQLAALVDLLVKAVPADRGAAEKTLGAVCGRAANKDAAAEALIKAMAGADSQGKAALIRVLGKTGGGKALAAVRAAIKDSDADIQDAAIRGLSDWPDATVAADLLDIAKTGAKPTHQVLALRGYIRLAGTRPDAEKMKMLQEAMATAKRPDEKKQVLGVLGDVKSPAALKMAMGCIGDEALKEEAAAAAVKVAQNLGANVKDEVKAAMQSVLEVSKNAGTRKDAQAVLRKLK